MEKYGITENGTTKISWKVPVRTDKIVKANRPDIILVQKDKNKVVITQE